MLGQSDLDMLAVGLNVGDNENADFHINQTQTALTIVFRLTSSVRSQTVLSHDI